MLVAGSIGRIVPVYGTDLFANVPDTFAPVQRLPVTPDYVIGPGDELLIRTWGQVSQNLHLTVDRSGSVYIPQVGEFRVTGMQFRQLQGFLKARLDRVYRNYDLNVNLGQLRSIQVFITGEARRPGSYTISSLSTVVNSVFACGGPGPQGSLRHILLALEDGDRFIVPPIPSTVGIVGAVYDPNSFLYLEHKNAGQYLRTAGGPNRNADRKQIFIIRAD